VCNSAVIASHFPSANFCSDAEPSARQKSSNCFEQCASLVLDTCHKKTELSRSVRELRVVDGWDPGCLFFHTASLSIEFLPEHLGGLLDVEVLSLT
jgi:hypothetical protein